MACLHDLARERPQLHARRDQPAQRRWIQRIVLRHAVDIGLGASRFEDRLVVLGQLGPRLGVDEEIELGAAFPPAGVVVVLRDLVQAELFVVVRADPFRGVDRALLQRGVDVAAGDLLRYEAELLHHHAGGAADAHLQALHVGQRLDLLAEPAAHLRAGVAAGEVDDVVLGVELAHQLEAVAFEHPRRHLP